MTPEDWIAAARKALIQSGVDDVKVERLAREAGVTRGSFYWHFKHRKELLEALLHDWEALNYYEMAQVRARWARTEPDLNEIVAIWLGEDPNFPAFSMAVRNWAGKSRDVADAMHRVDDEWVLLLQQLFDRGGYDATDSLVRARIVYFHQVGYHAIAFRESLEDRLNLVPYYYKVLTGREPAENLTATLDSLRVLYQRGKRARTPGGRRRTARTGARKAK